MDNFDRKLLQELQRSSTDSNAAIGERLGLSASQVSRRRVRLEEEGIIESYRAILNADALGFSLDAVVRVKLRAHSEATAKAFTDFVTALPQIRIACAITGDADYLLYVRVENLESLSQFINQHLLANDMIAEVRSDVVLQRIKDHTALPI